MNHFVKLRIEDKIPDLLLMLSFYPVLTLGARKLDKKDLQKPVAFFKQRGIEILKFNRGGGLTFHWPGQLVVYPILKLRKEEQHLSKFMYQLEEVGLRTLKDLGINAERKRNKTAQIGLWHNEQKIASMGIAIFHWVTSYGFALNISGDFRMANYIRPCGLEAKLNTIENILGFVPDREKVISSLLSHFQIVFNRTVDNFMGKNISTNSLLLNQTQFQNSRK